MKFMEVQHAIKNNADDLQTFVREMKLWEKEMKRKEKLVLESPDPQQDQELPPVRSKLSKMEGEVASQQSAEQNPSQQLKKEQSLFEKERGNECVKQGNWTQAIHHYTEAIDCYSWDATFYGNRALCFLKLGKWKEAETDCTTALQIDKSYEKAYFRRALALKELNQLKQARDDFLEVLRLDPDNKVAQTEVAKLENMLPEQKGFEMKVDLPKDKKEAAEMKKAEGNAHVKLRKWKSAIECYTEACSLNPEEASFYLNRALCFLKTNEPQKTILDCCRVLELSPDNVKAYYRRALAHLRLNNLSKAHDDLLTAIGIDPSNEDVESFLNTIEIRLGIRSAGNIPEEPKEVVVESNAESHESAKRITGERFSRLGGHVVKPQRKAAHVLSKKPLRKIQVVDKDENADSTLENVLRDLNGDNQNILDRLIDTTLNGGCEPRPIDAKTRSDVNDLPVPKNCFQFLFTWDKLNSDPGQQFAFLKDALESHIFSEILDVITIYSTHFNEPVYEFLHGLSKVRRFTALLLFATSDDTENIKQSVQYCVTHENISEDQAQELKTLYQC